MIPTSRPCPPPRDVFWFNPKSPQIPPTAPARTSARSGPEFAPQGRSGTGVPPSCPGSGGLGAGRNREQQSCQDLSMLLGHQEKATGIFENRLSLTRFECRQPHWRPTIQYLHSKPERRRIVAQVRREACKNRGFFAS